MPRGRPRTVVVVVAEPVPETPAKSCAWPNCGSKAGKTFRYCRVHGPIVLSKLKKSHDYRPLEYSGLGHHLAKIADHY